MRTYSTAQGCVYTQYFVVAFKGKESKKGWHGMHAPSCAALTVWPTRLLCPWNFSGKNTRVGCHFLLQGIFPTQRSNPHLLHFPHWQVDSLPLVPPGKPE